MLLKNIWSVGNVAPTFHFLNILHIQNNSLTNLKQGGRGGGLSSLLFRSYGNTEYCLYKFGFSYNSLVFIRS